MYKYLTKEQSKLFKKPIHNAFEKLFKKLKKSVQKGQKNFSFSGIEYVGSGASNLLTYNVDTGFFDLDYNFYISKYPDKWTNNFYGLKSFIKTCLDDIFRENQNFIFKDGEDSNSVLTYRIFDKYNKHICNFDLAIFIKDQNSSDYLLLKHDKISNECILNQRKDKQRQDEMQKLIKKYDKKNSKLRKRYLELKNTTKGKPSRELYAQALNEIYLLTPTGQKEARLNNRNNRADQLNPNNAKTKRF